MLTPVTANQMSLREPQIKAGQSYPGAQEPGPGGMRDELVRLAAAIGCSRHCLLGLESSLSNGCDEQENG